ncbi:unnamed protein product [Lymnaea stagnalis]|uniref:ILCR1 Ig-like domain-containing protein n=1 Tax=Lymnaea stagnalis TaxID=6523 RepID=A0AAV2HS98_LYMST
MHLTSRLLVAILVCWMDFLDSAVHPCLLKIFEDGKEINNFELCEMEYTTKECTPFITSFERSAIPGNYPKDGWPVQRPSSINLIGLNTPFFSTEDNRNYSTPGVTIQWEPPLADAANRDLDGFLFTWKGANKTGCRLFKTTLFPSKFLSNLTLSYDIARLLDQSHYVVSVYSMPPPRPDEKDKDRYVQSMRLTTFGSFVVGTDPALWAPSVSVKTWNNGTIDIKFTLPPPEFNLTMFEIMMFKKSEGWSKAYKTVEYNGKVFSLAAPEGSLKFTNLPSDCYQIVVSPIDSYRHEKHCLCWKHDQANTRFCEASCARTRTEIFYLNVTKSHKAGPDYEENSYYEMMPGYDDDIEVTSMTSTTYELAELLPSTIQRTDSALIGGLVGGFASACLFSLLIIVCLAMKKPESLSNLSDADSDESQL